MDFAGIVWGLLNRMDKLASLLATVLMHTGMHRTYIASCGKRILKGGPVVSFDRPGNCFLWEWYDCFRLLRPGRLLQIREIVRLISS